MGIGDEIIGSGLAKGAASQGSKVAFGDGKRILWTNYAADIYNGNPNVAWPGEETLNNLKWVDHYKGKRAYNALTSNRDRWIWNYDFKVSPGEMYFTDKEKRIAEKYPSGFIVMEPNVPWQKSVANNKDWGEEKYSNVSKILIGNGYKVIQFHHNNTRRIIEGAEVVTYSKFRQVLAILSRALLYIGPEGGMHHGSAAVGIPAVVLFGGFIPPRVMGYDDHINLTGGTEACGSILDCKHCKDAMARIGVNEVLDAVEMKL